MRARLAHQWGKHGKLEAKTATRKICQFSNEPDFALVTIRFQNSYMSPSKSEANEQPRETQILQKQSENRNRRSQIFSLWFFDHRIQRAVASMSDLPRTIDGHRDKEWRISVERMTDYGGTDGGFRWNDVRLRRDRKRISTPSNPSFRLAQRPKFGGEVSERIFQQAENDTEMASRKMA